MVYISDSKYMVFHALTTVPTLLLPQEDYKGVVSSVSPSSKQHNISNSYYSGSFLSTNLIPYFRVSLYLVVQNGQSILSKLLFHYMPMWLLSFYQN